MTSQGLGRGGGGMAELSLSTLRPQHTQSSRRFHYLPDWIFDEIYTQSSFESRLHFSLHVSGGSEEGEKIAKANQAGEPGRGRAARPGSTGKVAGGANRQEGLGRAPRLPSLHIRGRPDSGLTHRPVLGEVLPLYRRWSRILRPSLCSAQ